MGVQAHKEEQTRSQNTMCWQESSEGCNKVQTQEQKRRSDQIVAWRVGSLRRRTGEKPSTRSAPDWEDPEQISCMMA